MEITFGRDLHGTHTLIDRKMNIVLIGMPGCGKSSVGRCLARIKKMKLVDVDAVIEKQTGKQLQEIIDEMGNEGFLTLEAQTVASLECDGCVIAPGGSAVLTKKGEEALKRLGSLVYLKHPFEELESRVKNLPSRGVTLEPGQTFRQLYDYRVKIYEELADVTIEGEGLSIYETAKAVLSALEK